MTTQSKEIPVAGRFLVKTLGCKANLTDSQILEGAFRGRGWQPWEASAPTPGSGEAGPLVCVVNSCTVTDEADRQSRALAKKLRKQHPGATIVFTGCAAEVGPERVAAGPGVDFVVGNQDKPRLLELLEAAKRAPALGGVVLGGVASYSAILSRHPLDREWPAPERTLTAPPAGQTTRAFLKIQEGCDAFCTYCIIPYGRGPSRSLEPGPLIEQIRGLVAAGKREVVFTGTNIGDYGGDPGALVSLLVAVLKDTAVERVRLSSLDPVEITPELLALMRSEPRLCAHLHVSLQSAHDRVLRLMKRKYGTAEARACLHAIAGLALPGMPGGVFVGMDLITGFPGETREEFEEGYRTLASLPWTRLHVFPYSERAGTPATRLPGKVPFDERKRRARALQRLSLDRMTGHLGRAMGEANVAGRPFEGVLLERASPLPGFGPGRWQAGYTSNYLRLLLPEQDMLTQSEARNSLVSILPERVVRDEITSEAAIVGRLLGRLGGQLAERPRQFSV